MAAVNVVFDGPPPHEPGRFVEFGTDEGRSVKVGEWRQRPDGWSVLRITDEDLAGFPEQNAEIREFEERYAEQIRGG